VFIIAIAIAILLPKAEPFPAIAIAASAAKFIIFNLASSPALVNLVFSLSFLAFSILFSSSKSR